ncbi:polymeric immunoglobulin receptor isoform X7 [Misgurnus anguillicaudatus]|uniref:polymeric immunoglobulin receptor isoform X7 n=1 Tax=Misgurnus anguillicaudatus TaxID=75329 RepID=UPI003CCF957F
MVAYGKAALLYTIIWFCLILGDECRKVTVQTGGSVIIPFHYESKYTQHQKYCCYQAGAASKFCSVLAHANETKGDVSVIDYPDQRLLTITLRDLQHQNTGDYWCGMSIKDGDDVIELCYITIQSAPDLSVMSSSVTVDEGGNISVQCLYNTKYKSNTKQWCRYKDKRCYTSQNASVEISDDRNTSLTMVMSGLMKSDSGWYYCSVNVQQTPVQDLLVPVQLTVKAAATPDTSTESIKTKTEKNTNTTPAFTKQQTSAVSLWLPVSAGLLLLMILVGVFIWKWKRRSKEDKKHIKMRNDCVVADTVSSTPEDVVIYSTINDENPDNNISPSDSNIETTYCLVEDPSGHKAQVPEDGIIYSFVEPHDQNPKEQ